jgi:DNA-binding NarL/FixJ family response regulator
MKRARLLLADDHTMFLEAIQKVLEPEFDLVGQVADGRALLDAAVRLRPDVILMNLSMPLLNGIDVARELSRIIPHSRLVFLSMHADPTYVTEAFCAGASAYVLKRSASAELIQAVRTVLRYQYYVSPLLAKDFLDPLLQQPGQAPVPRSDLTVRQREVLQLVAEGRSLKEIAGILNVSVKTVEFHKSRIMKDLGMHTTAELTKYAITHGLISA